MKKSGMHYFAIFVILAACTNQTNDGDSTIASDSNSADLGDYPDGPYGFESSYPDTSLGITPWTQDGQVIPNICLPNSLGETNCLSDYFNKEDVDILFIEFMSFGNSISKDAASTQKEFISYLRQNDWNVVWITISEGLSGGAPPTMQEAFEWSETFKLAKNTVWYDENTEWLEQAALGRSHSIYTVHTSNMLIWKHTIGWANIWNEEEWSGFKAWWPDFFGYAKIQEGAIFEPS